MTLPPGYDYLVRFVVKERVPALKSTAGPTRDTWSSGKDLTFLEGKPVPGNEVQYTIFDSEKYVRPLTYTDRTGPTPVLKPVPPQPQPGSKGIWPPVPPKDDDKP